jgi:uncharacterized GH25 family protein
MPIKLRFWKRKSKSAPSLSDTSGSSIADVDFKTIDSIAIGLGFTKIEDRQEYVIVTGKWMFIRSCLLNDKTTLHFYIIMSYTGQQAELVCLRRLNSHALGMRTK